MLYTNVLEAIKAQPKHFILTCLARSKTTPNHTNRVNHLEMADAINTKNWIKVEDLLLSDVYRKPLDGVVYCLSQYSDIDSETHLVIVDLFVDNKLS